jgi:hypothetical protein
MSPASSTYATASTGGIAPEKRIAIEKIAADPLVSQNQKLKLARSTRKLPQTVHESILVFFENRGKLRCQESNRNLVAAIRRKQMSVGVRGPKANQPAFYSIFGEMPLQEKLPLVNRR